MSDIRKNSLLRNSAIFTFANVMQRVVPFLVLPILSRYLSPADFGLIAIFVTLSGLILPLIGCEIQQSIYRRFYDLDADAFARYVTQAILVLLAGTLAISVIVFLVQDLIAEFASFPSEWLWAVIAFAVGQVVMLVRLVIWQVRNQVRSFAAFQIARSLITCSLAVGLVVHFKLDWTALLWSHLLATGMLAVWSVRSFLVDRLIRLRDLAPNRQVVSGIVAFGLPLIPYAMSTIVIQGTDRLFISYYDDTSQTGIYYLGYQVGLIVGLLHEAFQRAWWPWVYERLKNDEPGFRPRAVRLTYVYSLCILVVALLLAWIAPWFVSVFFGKAFGGAKEFVVWIALGYAFDAMHRMQAGYILYAEKTRVLAGLSIVAATINIGANAILVPESGASGAAQATMITFCCLWILAWVMSARVHPMPWGLRG